MPFVAGNDIDAHCPKCSKDTLHTVIDVHDGIVQEVRCQTCKDQHPYKRPVVPKKAPPKKAATRRKTAKKKAPPKEAGPPREWQDYVMGRDPEEKRPYSIKDVFAVEDIIEHKKFGLGVVTTVAPDGKIHVAFREGYKVLVHGR